MTVQIYMKNKGNLNPDMFEDYNSNLYTTLQNVLSIQDFYTDYDIYSNNNQTMSRFNKKEFYLVIKEF